MVEARSKPVSQDSSRIRFQNIFEQVDLSQRKTSICCTLGQSSHDVDTLVRMLDEGMNIARLNFATGDHKVSSQERLHYHHRLTSAICNRSTAKPC